MSYFIRNQKGKRICNDVFRDYSEVDEQSSHSDFNCGILANLFPRDVFYEITHRKGKNFIISWENVADENYEKLFENFPGNEEMKNPLFINWMVV